MRVVGPNCVGTMDVRTGLNSTFIGGGVPPAGPIAFISQSGAICGGVIDLIINSKVGFSHFASLGNEMDVTETDMLEYFAEDDNVKVIAMYIEGIVDGQRFMEAARKYPARNRSFPKSWQERCRRESGQFTYRFVSGFLHSLQSRFETGWRIGS